jgi:hypothetical protein
MLLSLLQNDLFSWKNLLLYCKKVKKVSSIFLPAQRNFSEAGTSQMNKHEASVASHACTGEW